MVIGRSGPKPERPQSYPAPSRCGPSRSGPIGRCGPSRSGPTGSMRPQSIRSHFTQKTFYRVRLAYHGPALVDPAPLCIRYISLVILPSYLRLTMVRSWSIRPTLQTRHIYLVILTSYLWLTMVRSWSIRPHFNCTLRPNVRAVTSLYIWFH